MEALVKVSQERHAQTGDLKRQKNKADDATQKIQFADFQKIELKIGEIQEAEPIPKSDRLLKLRVDVGEENPRQIVAGIKEAYETKVLVGKHVVVVTNLAPAQLMGVESQGMLLAANGENVLALVHPAGTPSPGTPVR